MKSFLVQCVFITSLHVTTCTGLTMHLYDFRPTAAFHVILSTRMLIHLRAWAVKTGHGAETGHGAMGLFDYSGTPEQYEQCLSTIRFTGNSIHRTVVDGTEISH